MTEQALGPLMLDIQGTALTDLDRERLCHPLVGGIILFLLGFFLVPKIYLCIRRPAVLPTRVQAAQELANLRT